MNTTRKVTSVISIVLIISLLFSINISAGTGTISMKQNQLNIFLGPKPQTLDPAYYGGALTSGSEGGHIINNTFEGLMREINGILVPAMAEKYSISKDGLIYSFTLRNAKWSDGKPVKAQDFEFAWKRALDPKLASDYAYLLYCIKGAQEFNEGKGKLEDVGVKALNDKTLIVNLVSPTSHFLHLTTLHNFIPLRRDMIEKNPDSWWKDPKLAVSNGPFRLSEFKSNLSITLEKNESYYDKTSVKLDRITAYIGDDTSAVKLFKDNKVHIVDNIIHSEIPNLRSEFKELLILPEHAAYYYIFNTNKAPLDNIKVRKALSLAIDRSLIVAGSSKPGVAAAYGIVPHGFKDSQRKEFRSIADKNRMVSNGDRLKQAKELLKEAGYPEGKGLPAIDIIYSTSPKSERHGEIAKAVKNIWESNLGITVNLIAKEKSVDVSKQVAKGDFMTACSGWGADYADPMTFLDIWTSSSYYNFTGWNNPEYDKLIDSANKLTGKERDELLYKAEKTIIDNSIIVPIYYLTDPVLVKDSVNNWKKTVLSYWWFGKTSISK